MFFSVYVYICVCVNRFHTFRNKFVFMWQNFSKDVDTKQLIKSSGYFDNDWLQSPDTYSFQRTCQYLVKIFLVCKLTFMNHQIE